MPTLFDREKKRFLQTYKRLPLEVERAEGMYVHTTDGETYLDFLGGIAVNALGHSHPDIVDAVNNQMHRYAHLSNFFYQDAQVTFAEKLCSLARMDRVFLANSGSEATEAALKLARAWGHGTGRTEIFGFSGGFHGRTYGALSIMDKPHYKEGMGPFLPDMKVLPFNDIAALEDAISESTCAVDLEFLQGEGGIRWAEKEFVKRIEELRAKFNFLLIADETQTGTGRTGDFFAFGRFGVSPDIVTLAKGIGGGLPLSAVLTSDAVASIWTAGRHGTTFGGNAISCAAGSVVLDHLANGLMERVAKIGEYLMAGLEELRREFPNLIREIRGAGAIVGIDLSIPSAPIAEAMLERRVIVNSTSETVIRLLPPYVVTDAEIDSMIAELRGCLKAVIAGTN